MPSLSRTPPEIPPDAIDSQTRATLRTAMRQQRSALPRDEATRRGEAAQRRLLAQDLWRQARSVALYVGIRDELPTNLLLREAWTRRCEVWLPRVRPGHAGVMDFVRCPDAESLRPGPFGLLEPIDDLPGCGPEDSTFAPQCAVLPGLAFDRHGGRLGYGGGYYDRFLAHGLPCPLVGLCFACQLVDRLPVAPWDKAVHYICTEECFLCL